MTRYTMTATAAEHGFCFELFRAGPFGLRRVRVPCDAWEPETHPGAGLLKLLADNDAASERNGSMLVDHETIACMSAAETAILALPTRCPYALHIEAVGALSDPAFKLRLVWLAKDGANPIGLRRTGALLSNAAERFLLAEPLYSLVCEAESVNARAQAADQVGLDDRLIHFGRFKHALVVATGDAAADQYLSGITIHHATGLAIEPIAPDTDFFAPVLFGDAPPPPGVSPDNEEVPVIRGPLLPTEHAAKFRSVLFPNQGARSHYRLGEGVYCIAAAPVSAALGVIEQVNKSDVATRAAFRVNPMSFLNEAIEAAGGAGDILCDSEVVREAMEYGERVLGVTEWNGVKLSFQIPVYRQWFPGEEEQTEAYTIEVPGAETPLRLRPSEVPGLRDAIELARAKAETTVRFGGQSWPLSAELEDTVGTLAGFVSPPSARKGSPERERTSKLLVLRVAENAEDLLYNARLRDPKGALARSADITLATKPLLHQVDGIAWLQQCFLSGMPGVLLADDMGLGKTFQVLAFLHWLRGAGTTERRPVLVVAPKKLLDVWRDEMVRHIGPEGLGRPVLAYDEYLRRLKIERGRDGELGRHTLDITALRDADWVLTTYETLRDYHFSFARVRFRVAIYDEAQKMKSMASLINNAAKSQQPDFVVLMTGTPIENSIMDLWTLLDVAWPGFLGMSGKEFAKTYGAETGGERLVELKTRLIEPVVIDERTCPPVMLRRFKVDILVGLPAKEEVICRETMPPEQVQAYDAVVAAQRAAKGSALQALQALRKVAFHPDLRMPSSLAEHEHQIATSARFRALFRVLDRAHRNDERVLVFVDLHLGQRVLGELIRHRYRMRRHPQVINGDTATKSLNAIKEDFQNSRGFDVLLLGPRSAGFGLTLTAANHVVHMNRWWNPAVEDQCSDRVYRLGQNRDVFVHLPVAVHPALGDNSYDVVLHGMLSEKRSLSREIVVPTMLTEADFRRMFSAMMGDTAPADELLDEIDRMGWLAFEDWTSEQFAAAGYQVNRTPRSGDGGADIILRPPPARNAAPIICQCKHRALGGWTDEQAVHDVVRARAVYGARYSWLKEPLLVAVTNGELMLAARNLARENNVQLVDRRNVANLAATALRFLAGQG